MKTIFFFIKKKIKIPLSHNHSLSPTANYFQFYEINYTLTYFVLDISTINTIISNLLKTNLNLF